ncbi:MAG: hypothetical protein Q9220_003258 [cf. Caloplaca sp. 1 TL-2023]
MFLISTLLVGATAFLTAVAQSATGGVAFTMTPAVIAPGGKYNITWGGGDPSLPVALTLRQGDYKNLDVVGVINGSVDGTSYLWTVPSNLPDRSDYALQISQGIDDSNFSGKIALVNSTASSSTSSSPQSATSSSSSSGATGGGAAVAPIQSAITSNGNSTTTTVAASNATTTVPAMMGTGAVVGTGAGASGSAATGTAMMRNTTMSMATLSSTASSTSTGESTSTTAEETGTSTGSGAGASPSSGAVERAGFRSSELALVLGAVVAVGFLG